MYCACVVRVVGRDLEQHKDDPLQIAKVRHLHYSRIYGLTQGLNGFVEWFKSQDTAPKGMYASLALSLAHTRCIRTSSAHTLNTLFLVQKQAYV